jgi:hypothetical protein
MKLNFLFVILIILSGICIVDGAINVTAIQVNQSVIVWQWNTGLNVTALSIDGYTINNADKTSNQFILSDLLPNEKHTIKIYTDIESESNSATTLSSSQSNIYDIIYQYMFLIIGIILIFVGIYTKRKEPYLIAGLAAFIGLGIIGENLVGKIIYIIFIIVCWYASFEG